VRGVGGRYQVGRHGVPQREHALLEHGRRGEPAQPEARGEHEVDLRHRRLALDVKVIECPSPLNVLEYAYGHSG
jgi:hypothetical protein